MAENESKGVDFAGPLIGLVLIFILIRAFSGLGEGLEQKFGIDTTFFSETFQTTRALSVDTPLNTKIKNTSGGELWSKPGEGELLGEVRAGSRGEVVDGPVLVEDELWFEVEYEDGTRGWLSENDIRIDIARDRKTFKENTPLGTNVKNIVGNQVRDRPNGRVVSEQEEGALGTIVGGPSYSFGKRWWRVRYGESGVGWVLESDIEIDTVLDARSIKENTPVGTRVEMLETASVLNDPFLGTITGEQLKGAEGVIIGGPITIEGERFWRIEFEDGTSGFVSEDTLERKTPVINSIIFFGATFSTLSTIMSLIFLAGIIYVVIRMYKVNKKEYEMFGPLSVLSHGVEEDKNPRWEKIVDYSESDSPNQWRMAILEADVLLSDLVSKMGYHGESLGEKLKGIEQSDFLTLNQAWEAHKIRNTIAHEGSDYILSQRETRRVIDLYRQVFSEFHII